MNVAIRMGLIIISVLGCRADASGVEPQTQATTNVFETPAMPEVMPEMGSLKTVAAGIAGVTNFPADSKSFMLVFNVKPAEAKKGKFGISFLPEKGDQAACEFQLRLDDMRAQFACGSLTNFAGSQKTLREGAAPHHVGDYAIENLIGADRPFTVRVIVKGDDKLGGSLIDAEIAGQRTMISYRADLTVKKMVIRAEGVELKNVQIASLKSAIAGHAGEHTKGTKPEAARTCETTSLPPPIAEPQPGEILFCERNPGRDYAGHYYADFGYDCGNETYWLHGADGGCLAIYSPKTGTVRTLLEDPSGAVRDPQIHYDGKKVLFSYRKGGTHHYNLYEMNLDGTGLRQITQGDWDDVEPAYLPDGGIAFCSTRCRRYVPCWLAPVAVLFRCNADGSDLRQLSSSNAPENTPAVLPDGRILYTRWEYVNRDAVSFHHLWTMNPDGTGAMVYYGNMHPGGVFIDAQPIPNTANVVFVDSSYHGQLEHAGKLTLLSLRNGPDDRSQVKPITGDGFRDPYPLSEHEFLAARGNEIVTVTEDGGVKILWKSKGMVHEPRLIAPRPRQAVIPSRVDLSKSNGTLMLINVYEGRNMGGVKSGSIKKMLVMEDLPKPVNFHGGGTTPLAHGGSWTFKRILGTVPVEADGSANFDIPACRSIYFAALDENDLSIKQMRSFVTVQPGACVSCIGCHENRTVTPRSYQGGRLAVQRAPSRIQSFAGIPEILDFPRDIQPILDRHCVSCHDTTSRKGGLVLSGDRGPTYSLAYYNLFVHRQIEDRAGRNWEGIHNIEGRPGGNDAPYRAFSSAAPLMKYIEKSHYEVKLSETERTTIRLWLDSATPYAGTAAAFGTGQIGGWWRNNEPVREMADAWPTTGPAKDAIQRRCATCHESRLPRFVTDLTTSDPYNDFEGWERPVSRFSRHTIFNLTHPDLSLALTVPLAKSAGGFAEGPLPKSAPVPNDLSRAPKPIIHGVVFASTDDPDYRAILAHLQAARDRLNTIKRFDMPGFKPAPAYLREMKRYGVLPAEFDAEKKDVDPYDLDRKYWQQFWHKPVRPTE